MAHGGGEERWGEDDEDEFESQDEDAERGVGRQGKWESGKGRCAVTGCMVFSKRGGIPIHGMSWRLGKISVRAWIRLHLSREDRFVQFQDKIA